MSIQVYSIFLNFFFIQILLIDSIYIATCADTLEEMIKKNEDDINHYQEEEITQELVSWNQTKERVFVCGSTPEERREPLKWKVEYSTFHFRGSRRSSGVVPQTNTRSFV